MTSTHEIYMQRCLQLARLGAGAVAPNPMVGSVLVYKGRIIGEGYHERYGFAHAEVNCINSVRAEDEPLLPHSTLYVSLEPCAHWGKTPPCADLIIAKNIPHVVVGCRDPFEAVNGKGIEKLRAAGRVVVVGVCEAECMELNKRFFTFHTKQRTYIILKWAQTADGNLALHSNERLFISHAYTNRKVHQWRSEEAAILVGPNTALLDNPALTNRLWAGKSPVRMVLDKRLSLPGSLHLFDRSVPTVVFNYELHKEEENLLFYRLPANEAIAQSIGHACRELAVQSVLVEGGSRLLQSFIDAGLWDEARIITNATLYTGKGVPAPALHQHQLSHTETIVSDRINYFSHTLS